MPSTATATETESPTTIDVNSLVKYGLLAVIAASAVNAIIRGVALAVVVSGEFGPLGLGPVIASSAVAAVGATIVYGVIARYSDRPNRTFTLIAAVVLVLSFGSFLAPPPMLAGAPLTVFTTLGVMHVAAAVAIVSVLTRTPNSEVSSQ
jgi:hypothetical protein